MRKRFDKYQFKIKHYIIIKRDSIYLKIIFLRNGVKY